MRPRHALLLTLPVMTFVTAVADEAMPLRQTWDYVAAMRRIATGSTARPGVVIHIGDSITYANPYGQWARYGEGKTVEDRAALAWMHTGADDDSDGWWLARVDHPDGGRSYTASGGLRADELLPGGRNHLPPLAELLDRYRPQMVVLMIGTNDISARRRPADYGKDVERAVDLILGRGAICILSTIPPYPRSPELSRVYNDILRGIGRSRSLPFIDFEREILERRPDDWNGTLVGRDDVHPTAGQGEGSPTAASAPTLANLRDCGYLLRGWLSVKKIAEVKRAVLDGAGTAGTRRAAPAEAIGRQVRLAVTRDTWFSNVGSEAEGNLGGAPRLKLKSNQEMSLIDIDPAPLRGHAVRHAVLSVRSTGEPRLKRVTVGTFGADWVEGTSTSYQAQSGSSSHNHRRNPDIPWTIPGSDLCSVILGQGGTIWKMADATPPDARGWQQIAVDPAVVAARVAGISKGFLLFDDTGTEWTRRGESFTLHHMPNRFVFSRDTGAATAPYLTVSLGAADKIPPGAPADIRSDPETLPSGEAWVSWRTPQDDGSSGTAGFFVTLQGKELPQYLVPSAGRAGERVRMHLRDVGLAPGAEVALSVRAVDGAGNVGPSTAATVRVSSSVAPPLPGSPAVNTEAVDAPKRSEVPAVAIIDELDKINPSSGEMIPAVAEDYLSKNHLWSEKTQQVRLAVARNEFVGFQIVLPGRAANVRPSLVFRGRGGPAIAVAFGRYQNVATPKGPLPDPIIPLDWPAGSAPKGQRFRSLHCEVYVPHGAPAGEHQGTLTLPLDGETRKIAVVLRVWDFTLPDYLSFLPEMNCYSLPANERDYYRLAHVHRTVLNRVPYSQSGAVHDGCAPTWDGRRLGWAAWDRRFGSYFDGTAFADLPRSGVPIECFYLPLHENWPSRIEANHNGDYWADRAFPPSYRAAFVSASRQIAEHFQANGWTDTLFHCFFNGKNDFKTRGWSRGSSPWLLDEPASFQDFWALRYFGAAFHEGVHQSSTRAKMVFRCDISRPQWQRDALDGLLDYNVVGGAVRSYPRIVLDRKTANGEIVVEYGSANAIEQSNVQPVAWCLDAWSLGVDGVLPWQTVGTSESWTRGDPLALFYPGRDRSQGPAPSIRLKAFRRGQQDVEALTLLALLENQPRWAVGRRVREALNLTPKRKGTGLAGGEDAGVIDYGRLRAGDEWVLRLRVGEALSARHPDAKRRLVELRTPPRDPSRLPSGYAR